MHVAVGQPTQEVKEPPMNSVGLDVHKTRCVACVKTPEGRILEEFAFQNNPHGHEELITHLRAHPQVQVAIESTGNLWIPIYNRLEDEQIHTVLTNPKKTRLIAEAKIKTDKLDARILADLLRANLLSASYVPPPEIRAQRSIIRERARLTQLRTIIKNRTHTLLDKHSIKAPYTDISGKHSLEWLSKLELPASDRILLDVNLEQLNSLNHSIDRHLDLNRQPGVRFSFVVRFPAEGGRNLDSRLSSCVGAYVSMVFSFFSYSRMRVSTLSTRSST
jgi:transposase